MLLTKSRSRRTSKCCSVRWNWTVGYGGPYMEGKGNHLSRWDGVKIIVGEYWRILLDNIPYPHIVAECKFVLVVLLLHGHVWGSIRVHHLWVRPCFSSSVLHLPEAMNDREKWRERVRDIRATSTTWWWWCRLKESAHMLGLGMNTIWETIIKKVR